MQTKINRNYTLDDKYIKNQDRVYLNGVQALVKLPLLQKILDEKSGLNTAGFISGYRGSPLGGLDLNLWKAKRFLDKANIQFLPGLNEDLAATAVWGSQQVNLWPGAKFDGVYAMWYGKGPGVDRCGDVFKHANAAGTYKHGGVLVLAGDDHACRSSTLPHQSEHEFISAMMPILNPCDVEDILTLGLYGWAMSRYTGRWVGFKTIAETVESSASIDFNPFALEIITSNDFSLPEGGLNIRWPDDPLSQEERLHRYGLQAALAFARANKLDKTIINVGNNKKLGIVSTGKSYLDVLEALKYLGINHQLAADIGISLYKISMTWPLEPVGIKEFCLGNEEIIVVEEKRSFIEKQLKEQLYNMNSSIRPVVIGKYDEQGNWVLPSTKELTPARIARLIASRLKQFYSSETIQMRLDFLSAKETELATPLTQFKRTPHFCSGCPHNTSTNVPEGSRALAGIGCHYMTVWMDRRTETFTQMGGEGVPWIGQAPFTETDHVFVNLGDGTYFHSGTLAIRACVAANVNATFKILYNDAVAMTGGQPVDGTLTVPDIANQVRAEGVDKIILVSDDPKKWTKLDIFPRGINIQHRDQLEEIQINLRKTSGISVIIYDQTCAAEKRRRRKRKLMEDPAKRVVINPYVCEGCGDCGMQSNCLSIVPLETEFGRKRTIDQSSCNKDFSCIKGFCPSFVTVHGGKLKKSKGMSLQPDFTKLPLPAVKPIANAYNILITGVGGTGVVTIGALIGMAAHLEGKGVTVLDQTGLAQKGGAVTSHVRIANHPKDIHAVRIAAGEANLILGCDMAVSASEDVLAKISANCTAAIINDHESMPGSFTKEPNLEFPATLLKKSIENAVGDKNVTFIKATRLATTLMGDAITANLFMLGFAWQKGLVPISFEALQRAIELNGVAIEMNLLAFSWGRLAAVDLDQVTQKIKPADNSVSALFQKVGKIEDKLDFRVKFLTAYQDKKYAGRYKQLVDNVRSAEKKIFPTSNRLTQAVIENFFKLMAYKDEYEVARLYTQIDFSQSVKQQFEGNYKLHFHMAPPLFAKKDPVTGHLIKQEFKSWMYPLLSIVAKFKFLRGTRFDVFGYSAERKLERQLINDYEKRMMKLLNQLNDNNFDLIVKIASIPEQIRGFGHVKEKTYHWAQKQQDELLAELDNMDSFAKAA